MPGEPINHRRAGYEQTLPGADYSADEVEFLRAMDHYKRTQRRPYPTWREVLGVLKGLGYRKSPPARGAAGRRPSSAGGGRGRGNAEGEKGRGEES